VDVVPVFASSVLYAPEPTRYSILYPVIGYPPVFDGADQSRFTCVGDDGTALSPVGGFGYVPDEDDVGVAETSDDALPVPIEFIAEIL